MRCYSLLVLLMTGICWADIVHLNDGTKVEGAIKRTSGGWLVTDDTGKTTRVDDENIKLIQKVSTLSPAELAESKLAVLRRSLEPMDDLGRIIERVERFIEQNKGGPAAELGRKELAVWKQRQEKQMVKVGKSWMTTAEQAELMVKVVPMIERARDLLKEGRTREADEVVGELLAVDDANVSGLYLRGLILFKQGETGQAKKVYEQLKEALPGHAPTRNNLAVILWSQRQHVLALMEYEQAMTVDRPMRQVLDNIAEALHALPASQRSGAVARRVEKKFAEQDADFQREMGRQGLIRWGATYIDRTKDAEIKRAQEKVKERLDALEDDYAKLRDRMDDIDRRIASNDREIDRIQADSRRIDPSTGRFYTVRYPGIYYDLRRENTRLKEEQVDLARKLDGFNAKAAEIRRDLPVPPYTGQQRMIEAEGTPLPASMPGAPGRTDAAGRAAVQGG